MMNDKLWGEIEKLRREIERLKTQGGTGKWVDVSGIAVTGNGSMTFSGTFSGSYMQIGNLVFLYGGTSTGTTGGTASTYLYFTPPVTIAAAANTACSVRSAGTYGAGWVNLDVASNQVRVYRSTVANWGLGANSSFVLQIFYEVA